MKTKIVISAILTLGISPLQAQGWEWRNPLPQGDNIRQFQFADQNHGWIVVQSSNILRTTNGGTTWKLHRLSFSPRRISFINANEGWAIGSKHPYDLKCGIYHTTNGGVTWEQQLGDTTELSGDIKFTDRRNGWAIGQHAGIWHTNDGGKTWAQQAGRNFVRPAGGDYALSFRDSLRGWAGGWMFYASKTFDGGKTWIRDSTLQGYTQFLFVDSTFGWASNSAKGKNVLRTTDGGLTWSVTGTSIKGLAYPISADTCFVFNSGVFKTTNGGLSWARISTQSLSFGFVVDSLRMWGAKQQVGGSTNVFYESTDGGVTWIERLHDQFGPGVTFLHSVDFADSLTGWVVGSTYNPSGISFIAKTTDAGKTWNKQATGLPNEPLAIEFVNEKTGWVVGRNGMILKTEDGGVSWSSQTSATSSTLWDVQFVDSQKGWTVGTAGVILKTTNGGSAWLDVTPEGIRGLGRVQFTDSLNGWAMGANIFLRSTDGGMTWYNPIVDGTTGLHSFFFVNPSKGWATRTISPIESYKIYSTADSGKTWSFQTDLNKNFFGGAIAFSDLKNGWVVGWGGFIYHTSNGGATWRDQTGATSRGLRDIKLLTDKKAVVVGDMGTVLYTESGGVLSNSNTNDPPPEKFKLYPNFPNPFNSGTTIRFELPEASEVSVEFYDILGRKVDTVLLGGKTPGQHQFRYEPKLLTSGIYFYRVRTEYQSLTGKVLLIR
jgi:photosystem II stability/assembly factor-like uncharacterized protein